MQQEIKKVYWEKLVRGMGELFDRFVSSDEVIRIDKLEVDLGRIEWKHFCEEFVKKALEKLELYLLKLVKTKSGEKIKPVPYRQNRFQQWLYFLENGVFDWRANIREEADFHLAVMDSLAMESASVDILARLLKRESRAFDRLVYQHDDGFLKTLAELYTGEKQSILADVWPEIKTIVKRIDPVQKNPEITAGLESQQSFRFYFWSQILQTTILERQKKTWQELVILFLRKMVQKAYWAEFENEIRRYLKLEKVNFPRLQEIADLLAADNISNAQLNKKETQIEKESKFPIQEKKEGAKKHQKSTSDSSKDSSTEENPKTDAERKKSANDPESDKDKPFATLKQNGETIDGDDPENKLVNPGNPEK
ncbi:MAG: hypothetical protein KDD63_26220, partial [Bacteroidetes bacterium]|nr:hypothetical protein [Bacteroidota bacterium]